MGRKLSVSIYEAAEMTGISRSNLYQRMAAGQLPFVKIGSRRLLLVPDIEALLNAHRNQPGV